MGFFIFQSTSKRDTIFKWRSSLILVVPAPLLLTTQTALHKALSDEWCWKKDCQLSSKTNPTVFWGRTGPRTIHKLCVLCARIRWLVLARAGSTATVCACVRMILHPHPNCCWNYGAIHAYSICICGIDAGRGDVFFSGIGSANNTVSKQCILYTFWSQYACVYIRSFSFDEVCGRMAQQQYYHSCQAMQFRWTIRFQNNTLIQ